MSPLFFAVTTAFATTGLDGNPQDLQRDTYLQPTELEESVPGLETVWMSDAGYLSLQLTNTQPFAMEIDWSQSVFIDPAGQHIAVVASNVSRENGATSPPTVLPSNSPTTLDIVSVNAVADDQFLPLVRYDTVDQSARLSLAIRDDNQRGRLTQWFMVMTESLVTEESTSVPLPTPSTVGDDELRQQFLLDAQQRWDRRWDQAERRQVTGRQLWISGAALLGVGAYLSYQATHRRDQLDSASYNTVASLGVAHITFGVALAIPGLTMWGRAKRDLKQFEPRPP